MNKISFRCTQQELYAVCIAGWNSCNQHLGDFSKFSPKYNTAFITERLNEVAAVKAMPKSGQRSAQNEKQRLKLRGHTRDCLAAWQRLKRYIAKAYPEDLQKVQLKDAGHEFYRPSAEGSWEACQGLMEAAGNFIAAELANLRANDNMPEDFPAEFQALKTKLAELHQDYMSGGKSQAVKTGEVQKANAKLYKDLMHMLLDGQEIYSRDAVVKKAFVFDHLLSMVSGTNTAGIKGVISNGRIAVSQLPGLKVFLSETDDEAFVDEDGSYRFSQLAAGAYTLHVHAEGYKELVLPGINVNTGAYTIRNLELEPVAN